MRPLGVTWLVIAALVGCQSKGAGPMDPRLDSAGAGGPTAKVWQPTPAAVMVFPGTRFVTLDSGRAALEARMQILDPMADPTKAAGTLRFELFPAANGKPDGPRLYGWDAALRTRDDQRTHYDPIIHGYVFRLVLDNPEVVRQPTVLRITFQPVAGSRISSQAPVRTDW